VSRARLGLHRESPLLVAVSLARSLSPTQRRARTLTICLMVSIATLAGGRAPARAATGASASPSALAPQAGPMAAPGSPAATPQRLPGDDDPEPKLSLPLEADREAWQRSGFRFGLGIVYGQFHGLDGAPSGRLRGFLLRLGIRLDADWSVYTSFQYALASSPGGLSGLRFAGTLDPTWHVTPHLSLSLGLGFGGIVEGGASRPDVDPLPSTLNTSYTFPSATPPLPSCSGVGVAGLGRVEWAIVLGPRSATSLMVEATGQWTGCVADTGRVEPDSGQAIVRRQWWPHVGLTAAWGISWR